METVSLFYYLIFFMFTVIFSCEYNALANLASIFVSHEAIRAGHSTSYFATLQLCVKKVAIFSALIKMQTIL